MHTRYRSALLFIIINHCYFYSTYYYIIISLYFTANLNLSGDLPFDIDHFSGAVRTTKLLDYETMRREFVLQIRASGK